MKSLRQPASGGESPTLLRAEVRQLGGLGAGHADSRQHLGGVAGGNRLRSHLHPCQPLVSPLATTPRLRFVEATNPGGRLLALPLLLALIALVGCGGGEETTTAESEAPQPAESLEQDASTWAGLFGGNDPAACDYMDDQLCDIYIEPGKSTAGTFQVEFITSTVDCFEIDDSGALPEAVVRFTGGHATEWRLYGEDEWQVVNIGESVGGGFRCP